MATTRPTHPVSPGQAWRFTVERADRTTFFFDFDGVLSPISDDPEASQPAPDVLDVLDRLSAVVDRVAIVSARPVSFLKTRFARLAHVDLYGLYGLEMLHEGETTTEPAALPWVPAMAELAERATLRAAARGPGRVQAPVGGAALPDRARPWRHRRRVGS